MILYCICLFTTMCFKKIWQKKTFLSKFKRWTSINSLRNKGKSKKIKDKKARARANQQSRCDEKSVRAHLSMMSAMESKMAESSSVCPNTSTVWRRELHSTPKEGGLCGDVRGGYGYGQIDRWTDGWNKTKWINV